jgi:hypothetical protein
MADTAPPDAAFLDCLDIFDRYVRANGSGAHAPTGRLERGPTGSPPAPRTPP